MAGRRDRGGVQVLADDRDGVVTREGRLPGEHFVKERPERVEIAFGRSRLSDRLLGGKVGDGADQGAGADPRAPLGGREPEVAEAGVTVVVEPDVGGLQIAVDDAARVGVLEGAADVGCDLNRPRHRQMAPLGGEKPGDVAPGHVFADDVGIVVLLAGVEDADDVRVIAQLAHRLRLAPGPAPGSPRRHRRCRTGRPRPRARRRRPRRDRPACGRPDRGNP